MKSMRSILFSFLALLLYLFVSPVFLRTHAQSNRPPIGYQLGTDNATCSSWGYAFDLDATGEYTMVHVYRDGPAGGGGTLIGGWYATLPAQYVNDAYGIPGNHGFNISFTRSTGLFTGTPHTLYIYAIDSAGVTAQLLTNSPQNITCPI